MNTKLQFMKTIKKLLTLLVYIASFSSFAQVITGNDHLLNIPHDTFEASMLGQSFTATITGEITALEFMPITLYWGGTSPNYDVSFYNGNSGAEIYRQTGGMGNVFHNANNAIYENITIATPFRVVAGNVYSFKFHGTTHAMADNYNAYPSGDLLYTNSEGQDIVDTGKEILFRVTQGYLAPKTQSIERLNPLETETTAATLVFRVTFNDPVINVDATDFTLISTVGGSINSVNAVSPTVYDVEITGMTPNGTIGLGIKGVNGVAGSSNIAGFHGSLALLSTAPTTNEGYIKVPRPVVITSNVSNSNIAGVTATLGGNATANGGFSITQRGIVYSSTNSNPVYGGSGVTHDVNGSGTGVFTKNITGLTPNTLYYYKAYAANNQGTGYGIVKTFTTRNAAKVSSIVRQNPITEETNVTAVTFRVTFNDPVKNITTTDFTVNSTAGSVNSVTPINTSVYDVAITGLPMEGTIGLGIKGIAGVAGSNGIGTIYTGIEPERYSVNQTENNNYFNQAKIGQTFTATGSKLTKFTLYPTTFHTFVGTASLKIYSGDETAGGTLLSTQSINISNSTANTGQTFIINTPQNVTSGATYSIVLDNFVGSGNRAFLAFHDGNITDNYPGGHVVFTGYNSAAHSKIDLKITIYESGIPFAEAPLQTTAPTTNETYTRNGKPNVTTFNSAHNVLTTSAVLFGEVTYNGGATVTERGIVYSSTDSTPEIGESGVFKMTSGVGGIGSFTETITGLTIGTVYYYRAYALNNIDTGYGGVSQFTTISSANSPRIVNIVRQNPATEETSTTAVTFRVVFNIPVKNVDATDFTTTIGSINSVSAVSTSIYDVEITGVTTAGTIGLGIKGVAGAIGNNNIIRVLDVVDTTLSVNQTAENNWFNQAKIGQTFTAITSNSLSKFTLYPKAGQHTFSGTANLKIYSGDETTGGATLLSTESITITASTDSAGQTFTLSTPTSLTQGSVYSIVLDNFSGSGYAFGAATFSTDEYSGGHIIYTGYGGQPTYDLKIKIYESTPSFDGPALETTTPTVNETYTKNLKPVVTTTTASNVYNTSAALEGNIVEDNGFSVTERGIVYSATDTTPEIGETGVTKETNGTGTGVFAETITGLTAETVYYYKAYAINNQGTSYGAVKTFTTVSSDDVPRIESVERLTPLTEVIKGSTVTFRTTFSTPVKNVDTTDFNTTNGSINNVSAVSTSVYNVEVTGITTAGTVGLEIKGVNGATGNNNIQALIGHTLSVSQTVDNNYFNQSKLGQTFTATTSNSLTKFTLYPKVVEHTFSGTADLKIYSDDESTGGATLLSTESITITNSTVSTGQTFRLNTLPSLTQGNTYSIVLDNFTGSGNYAFGGFHDGDVTDQYAGGHIIFTGYNSATQSKIDLTIKIYDGEPINDGPVLATTAPTTNETYTRSVIPTVTTTNVSNITGTTAGLGGNVVDDADFAITERGIVYSATNTNPEIGGTGVTKDINGTAGTGVFSKTITGLTDDTLYYYKAYATNSETTGYGAVKEFMTPNVAKVISIERLIPLTEQTNATTVTFRVTIDTSVKNVDVTDFTLNATSGSINSVTPISKTVYDVEIIGLSATGTIGLDIKGVAGTAGSNDILTLFQQETGTETLSVNQTADNNYFNQAKVGQTFTATTSLSLSKFTLYPKVVEHTFSGTADLKIYSGDETTGGATLLSTESITITNSTTSAGQTYTLNNPQSITQGNIYSIVLDNFTGSGNYAFGGFHDGNVTDQYVGGHVIFTGYNSATQNKIDLKIKIYEKSPNPEIFSVNQTESNAALSQDKVGQTFTATSSKLTKFTIYPQAGTGNYDFAGTASLKIYSGDETDGGTLLSTQSITLINNTDSEGQTFTLSTPQNVTTGDTYSIVLDSFAATSGSNHSFESFNGTTGTAGNYIGGHVIFTGYTSTYDYIDLKINIYESGGFTEMLSVNQTVNNDYFNQDKLGQTFTATTSNNLTRFTLYPKAGNHTFSGTADLKIYSGDETAGGILLSTQSITITNSTASAGQTFMVSTPQSVTAGNTYSIVLDNFSGSGNRAFGAHNGGLVTDVYTGGHIIFTGQTAAHDKLDLTIKIYETGIPFIEGPALATTAPTTNETYIKNGLPTVTTTDASNTNVTTITLAGNVTDDAGFAITERGIVYSATNTNPEIGGTGVIKDANGNGIGVFTETVTGLTENSLYYYKAYATNSETTGYGDVKTFTTEAFAKIISIERLNPLTEEITTTSVTFRTTFNVPVINVDATDFSTNTTTGGSVNSTSAVSTNVYDVEITGIILLGTIGLDIKGVAGAAGVNDIITQYGIEALSINQTADNDYFTQAKIGQTFTATASNLTKFTLYPKAGQHTFSGTASLKIYSGDETTGTATLLSNESITIANNTDSAGQTFTLSTAQSVTAGNTYSIVLDSFSGSGYAFGAANFSTDSYTGGHVIYNSSGAGTNIDLKIKIYEEGNFYDGPALLTTAPTTNETYIKSTAKIVSIERLNPLTEQTIATTVTFRTTFDKAVKNVDATDFTVNSPTGSINSVTPISTSVYAVEITGLATAGSVGLDIKGVAGATGSNDILTLHGNGVLEVLSVDQTVDDNYFNQPKLGQTFIATTSNNLTKFTLYPKAVHHTFSGTANLKIYSGDETSGSAILLFTESITITNSTDSAGQTFIVSTPQSVTAGNTYSIVLDNFAGSGDRAFGASHNATDPYIGGHIVFTGYNAATQGNIDLKIKIYESGIPFSDGPALATTAPTTNETYTKTTAKIISIERQNPTTEEIRANTVTFRTTFDTHVKNVDVTDFILNATSGSINSVNPISGDIYDVEIIGLSTSGSIGLSIKGVDGVAGTNDILTQYGTEVLNVNQTADNNYFTQDKIGQTFTATASNFTKFTLYPKVGQHTFSGTADLKIYSGDETDGTAILLSTESITITNSTDSAGQTFTLSIPQIVTVGNIYSIVLDNFSGTGYAFGAYSASDQYTGGHIIFTGYNSGTQSHYDLTIKIYESGTPFIDGPALATTAPTTNETYIRIATPIVTTTTSSNVAGTFATLGGDVTDDAGFAITERGIVYSTTDTTPEIGEAGVIKDNNGTTGTGVFTENITGLTENTLYYYKAYAINSEGTNYGEVKTFTTGNVPKIVSIERLNPSTEIITTSAVTFRTTFSMPVKNVDATDFSTNTTTGGSINSISAVSTNVYDVAITGITIVGTLSLDIKGVNGATSTNDIVALMGDGPTEILSVDQTADNDYFTQTKIGQTFTAILSNLTKFTLYPKAGQHTFSGTANLKIYSGDETTGNATLLSTESITITNSTDSAGQTFTLSTPQSVTAGNTYSIVLDNFSGSPFEVYAFGASNFSTDQYLGGHVIFTGYTAAQNKIDLKIKIYEVGIPYFDGSALATTAPTINETYTKSGVPTVITTDAISIVGATAILGGNVTEDVGFSITERGIVYSSTDTNPEIGDTGVIKDTNGSGTGIFTETITGLTGETLYYYKAYAINSEGTSYGEVKIFTTLNVAKIVSIERLNPLTEQITVTTVTFRATFDSPVKNVDATDFTLNTSTDGSINSVTPIGLNVYDVEVIGLFSSIGTIGLDIKGVAGVTGVNDILTQHGTETLSINQIEDNDYFNQTKLGQTFTATGSSLTKFTLYPKVGQHTFSGTANLKIYSGDETAGGETLLSTESITITNSTDSAGQTFTLSVPQGLTTGNTYSIVLDNFTGSDNYAFGAFNDGGNIDQYTGGHIIFTGYNSATHNKIDLKIKIYEERTPYSDGSLLATTAPTINETYTKTQVTIIYHIWENDAWTNGAPILTDEAIIRDNYNTLNEGNIEANTLTIDASFIVIIHALNYIKLQSDLVNNGTFIIEPTGTFVQVDDTATNTGTGTFTTKVATTNLIDDDRFTYFSSPSQTATLDNFSPWAKMNSIWSFDTITQYWSRITDTSITMQTGIGYAIQPAASNTFPFIASAEFDGAFNNGVVVQSLIYNAGGTSDDYNLVGNPYPSAIDASMLLNNNLGTNAFYFWTHQSAAGTTGYLGDDYSIWNNTGGTASDSGSTVPTGYIASGQGFFVEANASGSLIFDNSIRVVGNNSDFRTTTNEPNENEDKIWINLTTNNGYFSQILIGFTAQGTNGFDPTYDATRINGGAATNFYLVGQNNEHFGIEARGVLNEEKTLTLGLNLLEEITSVFTLSIDHFENLEGATVFVKDNLLNRLHNLRLANYTFNLNDLGTFEDRFELIFNRNALSINDIISTNNLIVTNLNETEIDFKMNNGLLIKQLKAYDVLGKLMINLKPNQHHFSIKTNLNQGTILFINALLENGQTISKKFIKL